jgi:hypothetical protein
MPAAEHESRHSNSRGNPLAARVTVADFAIDPRAEY